MKINLMRTIVAKPIYVSLVQSNFRSISVIPLSALRAFHHRRHLRHSATAKTFNKVSWPFCCLDILAGCWEHSQFTLVETLVQESCLNFSIPGLMPLASAVNATAKQDYTQKFLPGVGHPSYIYQFCRAAPRQPGWCNRARRGARTRTSPLPLSADRPCAIEDREREELTVVKSHRLLCAWVPYLGVEDAISWSVIAIKRHLFSVVDTS